MLLKGHQRCKYESPLCSSHHFSLWKMSTKSRWSNLSPQLWAQREQDEWSVYLPHGFPHRKALQGVSPDRTGCGESSMAQLGHIGPQTRYSSNHCIFLNPFQFCFRYFYCLVFNSKCACYLHCRISKRQIPSCTIIWKDPWTLPHPLQSIMSQIKTPKIQHMGLRVERINT